MFRAFFVLMLFASAVNAEFRVGGPEMNGKKIRVDLPMSQHIRNVGGSDGKGLCVFASISHGGDWSNNELRDLFEWMRTKPGGGWPSKVDAMISQFSKEKRIGLPNYIQHTAGEASFLEAALQAGRYPAVTYSGRDNVYYSKQVAHMVNLVLFDKDTAVIHDNNYPGKYLWMSREDFLPRWREMGGGWAIVPLDPGPPPLNVQRKEVPLTDSPPEEEKAFYAGQTPCVGPNCLVQKYEWKTASHGKALYQNGVQVGWLSDSGEYKIYDPKTKSFMPGVCPTSLPGTLKETSGIGDTLPTGVEPEKIEHKGTGYRINGTDVTRQKAFESLAGSSGVIDDTGNYRVTAIGPREFLERIQKDWRAASDKEKTHWLFQTYTPSHWAVERTGYKGSGPAIILQSADTDRDGVSPVIETLETYEGPERLLERLRVCRQKDKSIWDFPSIWSLLWNGPTTEQVFLIIGIGFLAILLFVFCPILGTVLILRAIRKVSE